MMKNHTFTAVAPAKIILTGEHSVVYGMPAIVTAVNRFAYAEIAAATSPLISLTLADLKQKASSTFGALRHLRNRLLESYHQCLNGTLSIRQVLQKPAELFQFTLINLIDTFQMQIKKGFDIKVRSDIPIGCGMGSSAATIVSVIQALTHFLKLDIKPEWLYRLSIEAEKLQHGFSSGVDSYISLNGGCAYFQNGKARPLIFPNLSLYIINTGSPANSTGEAVMGVASRFKTSSIWKEFEAIAIQIEQSLTKASTTCLSQLIRINHQLLKQIGVVPDKVQHFISDLENEGVSAKICGAGAIRGDNGGIVLALAEKAPTELCQKYGYSLIEAQGESQGARLIHV